MVDSLHDLKSCIGQALGVKEYDLPPNKALYGIPVYGYAIFTGETEIKLTEGVSMVSRRTTRILPAEGQLTSNPNPSPTSNPNPNP